MYAVYIIHSGKLDKYYIGFSSNLPERIKKHNRLSKGFTAPGRPWILKYWEAFSSKAEAMAREKQLKSWKNRQRIEELIKARSEHPD